jgi:cysteinyl-tRNA synthetase
MKKALLYEQMLIELFRNIKACLDRTMPFNDPNAFTKFDEALKEYFSKTKTQINLALCDSIDTPSVMESIRQLISTTNSYITTANQTISRLLLRDIALYITYLINTFGLNSSGSKNLLQLHQEFQL